MINSSERPGFTIIELLVVIVVVLILAGFTAAMYTNFQAQARDAQVRDAATKLADAIQLYATKYTNGRPPAGGYGSTSNLSGVTCTNGSTGWQAYGVYTKNSNYMCTVGDALVATGYLTTQFFDNLPASTYTNGTNKELFMTASCSTSKYPSAWLLFYNQEAPSQDETESFNNLLVQCGFDPAGPISQRDTYKMHGAVLIPFSFS